jgi:beta-lactamase superfamily II metal-dependent hydrolase
MYNGIEIDMLSLGNADCILVSFWNGLSVYRVLIDGGNKGDAPTVRGFLRGLNITKIDDVLSTHLHDDHSGGLIELLSDCLTTLSLSESSGATYRTGTSRTETWTRSGPL